MHLRLLQNQVLGIMSVFLFKQRMTGNTDQNLTQCEYLDDLNTSECKFDLVTMTSVKMMQCDLPEQ